jgi:hypothetical protein
MAMPPAARPAFYRAQQAEEQPHSPIMPCKRNPNPRWILDPSAEKSTRNEIVADPPPACLGERAGDGYIAP